MKLAKKKLRRRDMSKRFMSEDMRYLQKAISGRSVYRNQFVSYIRKPKHRSMEFQY